MEIRITGENFEHRYDPIYKLWNSGNLEREWIKKYEDMAFFCKSKDEKRIEEIYIIPHREIEGRKNISIVRCPTDSVGDSIIPWYEKYRVKNAEEIKKANEIWQKILDKEIRDKEKEQRGNNN